MAKLKEPNPVRFGPPSPVPKIGDIIEFIRPPYQLNGETPTDANRPAPVTAARVVFVAPETALQGRVINLEVPLPDGSTETHINVPFYPTEVMDEDDTVIANTWHWAAAPEAAGKNKKSDQ